jgi:hypothetical protein
MKTSPAKMEQAREKLLPNNANRSSMQLKQREQQPREQQPNITAVVQPHAKAWTTFDKNMATSKTTDTKAPRVGLYAALEPGAFVVGSNHYDLRLAPGVDGRGDLEGDASHPFLKQQHSGTTGLELAPCMDPQERQGGLNRRHHRPDESDSDAILVPSRVGAFHNDMISSFHNNNNDIEPRNEDDAPSYLAQATLVEEEKATIVIAVLDQEDQKVKVYYGFFVLALLLVIGVIVGLVVALRDKGSDPQVVALPPTQSPTSAPTERDRRQAFRTIILSHHSIPATSNTTTTTTTTTTTNVMFSETTLNDPPSPHYAALSWLVEEDEFIGDPQDDESLSTVILERFVMVVLYFSTQGGEWVQSFNFLLPQASVCEWQDEELAESGSVPFMPFMGVGCDEDGSVNSIFLGTYVEFSAASFAT